MFVLRRWYETFRQTNGETTDSSHHTLHTRQLDFIDYIGTWKYIFLQEPEDQPQTNKADHISDGHMVWYT